MHFSMLNGFNCTIPDAVHMYQKGVNGEQINDIQFYFNSSMSKYGENNNVPQVSIILFLDNRHRG